MATKIVALTPPEPIVVTLNVSPIAITGLTGADGVDGIDGIDGLSAYDIAVNNGFVGSIRHATILDAVYGSDHCPVAVEFHDGL
jgi:hypothetical protein